MGEQIHTVSGEDRGKLSPLVNWRVDREFGYYNSTPRPVFVGGSLITAGSRLSFVKWLQAMLVVVAVHRKNWYEIKQEHCWGAVLSPSCLCWLRIIELYACVVLSMDFQTTGVVTWMPRGQCFLCYKSKSIATAVLWGLVKVSQCHQVWLFVLATFWWPQSAACHGTMVVLCPP